MIRTGLILTTTAFLLAAVTVQADDISTLLELQNMQNTAKNYVLVNDIDASPTTNWNELIDNGTWADSEDYERVMDVSHPLVTHDGLTYYALQSSGPNYGGAQEPGVVQLAGTVSAAEDDTALVGTDTLFTKLSTNAVIRIGSGASAESRTIATIVDDENLTVTVAWDSEHTDENIFQPAVKTAYWVKTELEDGHKLGFEPVRTSATTMFNGSFDGQGFTISNLYINRPEEDAVGLFSDLNARVGVIVKNLTLTDVDITGGGRVGAVTGYGSASSAIDRCGSSGIVRVMGIPAGSMRAVGGLQGSTYQGFISNCWSTATVIAYTGYPAGGLVGLLHNNVAVLKGALVNSFALGDVTGTTGSTGGLVGSAAQGSTISNCYARGTVTVNADTRIRGGLVGDLNKTRLSNSYSTGKVLPTGGSKGGGLVGQLTTGELSEDNNNFWDTEASDWATSAMGSGRTTEQMKDISTFLNWEIATGKGDLNDGYPFLNWDNPPVWRIPPVPGTVLRIY